MRDLPKTLLDAWVRDKRYGERQILDRVALALYPGEIVTLVGASGCGKSTLLRIIAGLDRDADARIALAGQPVAGISPEIGVVFQEPRLFPWLTVAENIAFDLGRAGRHDVRVAALLAEVGLAGLGEALPKQLSGGQAQRVAIARALFRRPRVLLLDEPFSAVDAFTRMKLQDLLASVAAHHGTTVLMVTHDIDEAAWLSDRVLVLEADPGRACDEVAVDLPRPRDRADPRLAQARAQVYQALKAAHAV